MLILGMSISLHILVHSLKFLKRSITSMNTFLPAEEKYSSAKNMRVVAVPSNHWFQVFFRSLHQNTVFLKVDSRIDCHFYGIYSNCLQSNSFVTYVAVSVVIALGCTVVTDAYTQVTLSVTFKLIGRKRLTRRIICNNRPLNAMIHRFQGPVDNDPSTVLSNTNSLLSVVGISPFH